MDPNTEAALHALLTGLPVASLGTLHDGAPYVSMAPVILAKALGWRPHGDLPGWIRIYLTVASLAAPLATAWFCRRRSVALQTAAVLAAALVAAPIFRDTYAASLLLLPAVWLGEHRSGSDSSAEDLVPTTAEAMGGETTSSC